MASIKTVFQRFSKSKIEGWRVIFYIESWKRCNGCYESQSRQVQTLSGLWIPSKILPMIPKGKGIFFLLLYFSFNFSHYKPDSNNYVYMRDFLFLLYRLAFFSHSVSVMVYKVIQALLGNNGENLRNVFCFLWASAWMAFWIISPLEYQK